MSDAFLIAMENMKKREARRKTTLPPIEQKKKSETDAYVEKFEEKRKKIDETIANKYAQSIQKKVKIYFRSFKTHNTFF